MPVMERAAAPERSYAQRMEALDRANAIRSYRAELKRDVKYRRRAVRDVLLGRDAMVETMKVVELLLAAPKVGRTKANKILAQSKISYSKTVGGLSDRQRRELAALLPRLGVV